MIAQQIDELVNMSVVGSPAQKVEASQRLHELKSRPDAVSIGMNAVLHATRDDARLYGSHIVRDYLQSGREMNAEEGAWLRQLLMEMVSSALGAAPGSPAPLPPFLVNNLLYILSLCIKRDYPERWPSAFHDIMQLGQSLGWNGVDVVVKVLNELEVEVVVYNEDRSRDEITHNTLIKDTMRATSVIPDIVRYLREAIQSAAGHHMSAHAGSEPMVVDFLGLAGRAMVCLSSLIGWIDINLVIVELFPMIRTILEQGDGGLLRSEALLCVYEIVKKGMDPVLKADLLQRLDILPVLVKLLPRFQGSQLLYQIDEDLEETKLYHRRIAMVFDIMLVELLGCLIKYEDGLLPVKRTSFVTGRGKSVNTTAATGVSDELQAVIPFVSHMLTLLVPEVINLLHHPVAPVASSVSPSIDRLVQLYKSQKTREVAIDELFRNNPNQMRWFLLQQEYTDALLVALWQQSQYPAEFNLEDAAGDEADDEFMEAKVEVRRLLINCARVNPARFLHMVMCFMAELPQPLSKAPVPALDICLHALQALESAVIDTCPEAFAMLFAALSQSDLAQHPNMLIQISFLEFSLRHWKKLDDATTLQMAYSIVQRIQAILLGISVVPSPPSHVPSTITRRLRSNSHGSLSGSLPPKNVVIKLTNLSLKITEVYPERWKLLLVMGLVVKDTILLATETYMQTLAAGSGGRGGSAATLLFPDVEVHLYEILAVLAAFVPGASAWQHFDAQQHGALFAQFSSFLGAPLDTSNAASVVETTRALVSSALPVLASPSTVGGSSGAAALYHGQFVQPLQVQMLSLLGQFIQSHCENILQQPPAQVATFQLTFEALLAQHMRNMIALLERFHKQYSSSQTSSAASQSQGSMSTGTSPTPTTPTPGGSAMAADSHLLPLLQQFSHLVTKILVAHRQSEVIRQRVYAFLRVMIVLVPNENTFGFVGQLLPMLLVDVTPATGAAAMMGTGTAFCASIESLVELLDQLMSEFQHHSFALVQSVCAQVVTTLWQRVEDCLSVAAAAVAPDATIPIKILLNFLMHAAQHRLAAGLFPAAAAPGSGSISLAQVFSWLIPVVQGFVPMSTASGLFDRSSRRIVKFTSFPLRRAVTVICEHLVQHFLLDAFGPGPSPPELRASAEQMYLLQAFVLQDALPAALLCLGSAPGSQLAMTQRHSTVNPASPSGESNMEYEHIKINLQDAATQAFLSEVAGLLHLVVRYDQLCATVAGAGSWPETVSVARSGVSVTVGVHGLSAQYLPWLLSQWLCWSPESAQLLGATLYPAAGSASVAIGTFREQFKQFARQQLA